jgi:hypothetical protein
MHSHHAQPGDCFAPRNGMVETGTVKTLSAYPTTPQPGERTPHKTKGRINRGLWMQAEMKFFDLAFLTIYWL